MAELVLKNTRIFVDAVNVSGDHNAATLTYSAELLDKTTFGSTFRKRVTGLMDVEFNAQGFTNVAKSEAKYGGAVGSSGVVSIAPQGGTVGNTAYLFQTREGTFTPFSAGAVGQIMPFDVTLSGDGQALARGKVLIDSTAVTATANGTAVAIDTVSTGEFLYGTLHVHRVSTAGAGSGIRARIQTSASSGFGSLTTQISFSSSTGVVGRWGTRKAGAITHTWARIAVTVTSSSRAYSVFCAVGKS